MKNFMEAASPWKSGSTRPGSCSLQLAFCKKLVINPKIQGRQLEAATVPLQGQQHHPAWILQSLLDPGWVSGGHRRFPPGSQRGCSGIQPGFCSFAEKLQNPGRVGRGGSVWHHSVTSLAPCPIHGPKLSNFWLQGCHTLFSFLETPSENLELMTSIRMLLIVAGKKLWKHWLFRI